MAQSGSASALGAEGRGFESLCPDHSESIMAPVAQRIEHRPFEAREPSAGRGARRSANRGSGPHCNGETLTGRADGNPVETGACSTGIRRDYTCGTCEGEEIVQTTNRRARAPGCESSGGKLSRGLQVRVLPGAPRSIRLRRKIDGGRSSVGRAPDCDSGRRGFESHRPPHSRHMGR